MSQETEAGRPEYPKTPGRVKDLMSPEWFSTIKPKKKLDPYVDALFESSMIKESEEETTDNSFVKVTVEETTDLDLASDIELVKDQITIDKPANLETTPSKSVSTSDRSRSEAGRTLIEYTNSNTPSPGQPMRSTVGETTVPPPTPIDLGASLISPATSTPGATPARQKNGSLVESELQSSDESIISSSLSSVSKDCNRVNEIGEITVIKLADSTLTGNSVGKEDDTHEAYDPTWVASQDTTCPNEEEEPSSCIAQRTRSRTDELRKINLSQIIDACNLSSTNNMTMEGSYEMINRSLDTTEDDNGWRNGIQWCNGLINLDSSLNKMEKYRNDDKRSEAIELYRKYQQEYSRRTKMLGRTYQKR